MHVSRTPDLVTRMGINNVLFEQTLKWPRDVLPLLLQSKLMGKAQETCASFHLNLDLITKKAEGCSP